MGNEVVVRGNSVPAGHKVAFKRINAEEPVKKYGQIIGFASTAIEPGDHVHTHNLKMADFSRDHAIGVDARPVRMMPEEDRASFQGIVRNDGRVGTRNYIGVLPTVNCSASVARFIADSFTREIMTGFANVDGVLSLTHGTGCGMSEGEGFSLLQRALAGYARNPNFAAVLLLGLGCEVNLTSSLIENMDLKEGSMFQVMNIQGSGGTGNTVRSGIAAIDKMLAKADSVKRVPVKASHITLGLECGGSDAFSGISANPALGAAVDLLVSHGGTAILSETPEIYGAEHLLTRKAVSREVGKKLIDRIQWWESYTSRLGGEINNNPTPGNKAGGLTTILEKSLGASAKGGTTNLVEVYGYAEQVSAKGLVFMDTPGYDAASVTGMVAGGANMLSFTTGRGTVCGFKPVPTIKLASNTEMYRSLMDDMDVNCGKLIDGKATVEEMGEEIFRLILETASGKKTKSELLGFGDNEFVPWQMGPVM
ncbi:MAG: altronate dehydratase [Deltaproteobacteria bacterium]|nr:altronate dehydratase [Deltaproteobacteria bacterium]